MIVVAGGTLFHPTMTFRRLLHRTRPIWFIAFFALLFAGTAWTSAQEKKRAAVVLRDGDVVFQSHMGGQGAAIAQATHATYTHCGIVLIENGEPIVWEAVGPVKRTPWKEFLRHGEAGHVVVKRPKEPLDAAHLAALKQMGEAMMGRPYDIHFQLDDERIYCSELVYKMYRAAGREVGSLERFCDMDLDAPIAHAVLVERFGATIPCDSKVITPAALFRAPQFVTVDSVGAPPAIP